MDFEKFTGKAQVYAQARPGYPDEVMEYIKKLIPVDAVFADIGAGTGKFTELIARHGYKVFAVEPNPDMREQLANTLAPFPNATIINGTAEATLLPDHCIDVITCAQALHWFDFEAFRIECRRIAKPNATIFSIQNVTPSNSSGIENSEKPKHEFFKNPLLKKFDNPILYSREKWLQFMTSHSGSPLPSDPEYNTHISEMNEIFNRDNVNGLLRHDKITKVYSEKLE